jgi:sulfite exporter TauE/SafE/copper chaperone CopZ
MKEIEVPIKGMHCRSCELLITEKLEKLPGIKKVRVSFVTKKAHLYYEKFMPTSRAISAAIDDAGYSVGYDKIPTLTKDSKVYTDAIIGMIIVSIAVTILTGLGITNLSNFNTTGMSDGIVALVLGLTAGFSTCMALIGGLVLGISSRFAEKHPTATPIQKFRPHLFFNLGRIISFFVLGGLIGILGSAISLQGKLLGLLTIIIGLVMGLLGLQLTELFPKLNNFSFSLPSGIAKFFGVKSRGEREYSHKNSMLIGASTFFLPCGFTQAMQLFAISTGSWYQGAIIMGAFAIGTTPGLLGVGGLTSIVKGSFAKKFFRIVGVAVVGMALVNVTNGYNLLGIGNIFVGQTYSNPQPRESDVILKITYRLNSGITPSKLVAGVGERTTIEVDVKEDGQGCMSTIMIPGLVENPQFLKGGKIIYMTFTADRPGVYQITCAMGIAHGTLTVK